MRSLPSLRSASMRARTCCVGGASASRLWTRRARRCALLLPWDESPCAKTGQSVDSVRCQAARSAKRPSPPLNNHRQPTMQTTPNLVAKSCCSSLQRYMYGLYVVTQPQALVCRMQRYKRQRKRVQRLQILQRLAP